MPLPGHMEVTGENQGSIAGSSEMEGREDSIEIYEQAHKVHIPIDPHTGLATGKRKHDILQVKIKKNDKSVPQLYQALCTGEELTPVVIKEFQIAKTGTEEHYFTTTLEGANIVSMTSSKVLTFLKSSEAYDDMLDLAFTYRKIKWKNEVATTESEDDWLVPK